MYRCTLGAPLARAATRCIARAASSASHVPNKHRAVLDALTPAAAAAPGSAAHHHKAALTSLPPALNQALAHVLNAADGPRIRTGAVRIFDSLRSTSGILDPAPGRAAPPRLMSLANPDRVLTPHHVAYDADLVPAYLAARMPACYAAAERALAETYSKLGTPDHAPRTVLDLGTGPGTAVWALRCVERDMGVEKPADVTAVDVNRAMLDAARALGAQAGLDAGVTFAEFLPANPNARFDLSIASFLFSEVEDPALRASLLRSLWSLTDGTMVIIDRGTPRGFKRLVEIRDWVLAQDDATILAPVRRSYSCRCALPTGPNLLSPTQCPHMKTCPLSTGGRDWCHFAQRLERPPEMQKTKHAKTNLEDVKFTYLVVKKSAPSLVPTNSAALWPRVLGPPLKRGGHVLLDVCTPSGNAERIVVAKSMGKDAFKAARKLGWGDQWPFGAKAAMPGRGIARSRDDETVVAEDKKKKDGGKQDKTKKLLSGESRRKATRLDEEVLVAAKEPAPAVAAPAPVVEPSVPAPAPAAESAESAASPKTAAAAPGRRSRLAKRKEINEALAKRKEINEALAKRKEINEALAKTKLSDAE
ncbi:37S ribosomal protein S22 [Blastocladiella emersonii ATCC 22665]|nr:37S ribosomal protein S22 [Blastocladiella emersonii ATCC 22665]